MRWPKTSCRIWWRCSCLSCLLAWDVRYRVAVPNKCTKINLRVAQVSSALLRVQSLRQPIPHVPVRGIYKSSKPSFPPCPLILKFLEDNSLMHSLFFSNHLKFLCCISLSKRALLPVVGCVYMRRQSLILLWVVDVVA